MTSGRRRDEARPVAGHRRSLAQRLKDDHAGAVSDLQGGHRRLVEPELRVRLVGGDHEVVPRRQLGELLVELERCHRAGWIVRIVHPDDRGVVVERAQVGEEAVLPQQRQRPHARSGKERAALVDRIRRLAEHDDALRRVRIYKHLGEREDRLLGPVRRDQLRVGVELDTEAACAPAGRSLTELRQTGCERIRRTLGQSVDERLPDHRVGRLVGIALAEVDHLDAPRDERPARLLEPDERVGRHLRERGRDPDRHRLDATEERSERLEAAIEVRDRNLLILLVRVCGRARPVVDGVDAALGELRDRCPCLLRCNLRHERAQLHGERVRQRGRRGRRVAQHLDLTDRERALAAEPRPAPGFGRVHSESSTRRSHARERHSTRCRRRSAPRSRPRGR